MGDGSLYLSHLAIFRDPQVEINAVYGDLINNYAGVLVIHDSILSNGMAGAGGGAILNQGTMSLERVDFIDNSAAGGGAIRNYSIVHSSLTCVRFNNNLATFVSNGRLANYGRLKA
jgi:hypothetical protein